LARVLPNASATGNHGGNDMTKITEGDMVDVYFENVECEFHLKVLYMPCASGDSWRLQRNDRTVVCVQSFAKMVKLNSLAKEKHDSETNTRSN